MAAGQEPKGDPFCDVIISHGWQKNKTARWTLILILALPLWGPLPS